jgi:hypothetical protein
MRYAFTGGGLLGRAAAAREKEFLGILHVNRGAGRGRINEGWLCVMRSQSAVTSHQSFIIFVALFAVALTIPVSAEGPRLRPEALEGWQTYVAATEARRGKEHADRARFLALDFVPEGGADRRQVLAGGVVVRPAMAHDERGRRIEVPAARVHHWRGAILVPGQTVDRLMAHLMDAPPPQADVLRAAVLERGANSMRVYLRLRRTRFITVVYDTQHQVTFDRPASGRAASTSIATRIVELDSSGTPEERVLPPGEDRGFLWRLNAYWRYEQVPGGVIAECESISLSRDVPLGLGLVAGPIINSTAKDSMEAALRAVKHLR